MRGNCIGTLVEFQRSQVNLAVTPIEGVDPLVFVALPVATGGRKGGNIGALIVRKKRLVERRAPLDLRAEKRLRPRSAAKA